MVIPSGIAANRVPSPIANEDGTEKFSTYDKNQRKDRAQTNRVAKLYTSPPSSNFRNFGQPCVIIIAAIAILSSRTRMFRYSSLLPVRKILFMFGS